MGAPSTIKEYIGLELHLPHTFWGPDDGEKFYPGEYKTGSRLVVLKKYIPADNDNVESLSFTAEDNDDYRIDLTSLKTYWSQKRFNHQSIHMFRKFVLLLCCCWDIYCDFVISNFSEDNSDDIDDSTPAPKRKGKKHSNKYINV